MRTGEEHAMVVEQLENICRALPWCQGLSWRFSDLRKDALADLYAALEGLSLRFCELQPIFKGPTTKNSLGVALARYLYDHPDRCQATLHSINRCAGLPEAASLLSN
ncbi:MAG: hypothetical protein HYR88_09905 [Verrucomicrobia bacterium]|nr:hypothetical protein [Verrucomicrobiota bacterium]MBI3867113.1 hypothetical protein [Verrucomicrobiota bacterium]